MGIFEALPLECGSIGNGPRLTIETCGARHSRSEWRGGGYSHDGLQPPGRKR
jgi:hypothetical protein